MVLNMKKIANMKDHEIYSDIKVPLSSPILVRLDGRRFHTLTKVLNLERPYDESFSKIMAETSKIFFKEFSPIFIYTFSDEFNILFENIPFSGRIEKLNSVFSSFISSTLTLKLDKSFKDKLKKPISFDSRLISLPKDKIASYFKWRQDEAWRNHINAYGYWSLREDLSKDDAVEKLKGLKSKDIHEMLFKKGINLNNSPTWQKRGIAIYRNKKTDTKDEIYMDFNLKQFNEDSFDKLYFK